MKTSKRMLSFLLVVVMLFTMIPVPVQATGAKPNTSVDTGNLIVEGTNGFGNLLSQEIQESQEESATEMEGYEAGFSIIDLTFDGAIATVEYSSLEEARLVVAVYSEDGLHMLASGETTVGPEEDIATVNIEGDMPEYFVASAYLMDTYDLSPLCSAYDTPMYTHEMQELLESTVDDYDPERVLNLDEDKITNFAVYAENTKIIEYIEGVNTVTSVDDETATYVIEYADEQFLSLAVGDVVAYSYGDNEILIAKVGAITIDGSTVTITGVDLEMDEVFSHVKVESNSVSEDMSVIEGTGEEGIRYVGLIEDSDGVTPYAVEGGATVKFKHEFEIKKTFSEDHFGGNEGGEVPNTITLAGTLKFGVEFDFDYYASWNRRYVKFISEFGVDINIGITGKLNKRVCKLPSFGVSPVIGVYIGIEPQFEIQASAELAWEASYSFDLGFSYGNDMGGENLTTPPKFESEIKLEGTLFFGIDFHPTIEVIGGTVVDVDLAGLVGFEINGKLAGSSVEHDADEVVHSCELCIQGDIQFKTAVSVKIAFLKCKDLTVELNIFEAKFKICDYYVSLTHGTLGLKTCPYTQYKIVFEVRNSINLLMSDTEILKKDGTSLGETNDRGILIVWLPLGKTTIKATVFGEELQKTIKVTEDDAGSKVVLKFGVSVSAKDYLAGAEDCIDETTYIASGKCGDKVYWTLSDDGILSIAGKGSMQYFSSGSPWYSYRNSIGSVIIGNGVTTIGGYAFSDCTGLTTVKIPDSVTSIGFKAFSDCTGLTSAEIPDNVSTIGEDAFYNCSDLTTVNIPDSVTTIGQRAFSHCTGLTAVEMPDSITSIANSTFRYCTNLTSVTIGEGVTSIGPYAFDSCSNLTSVTIPDSVTSIGKHAFSDCTGLTSMVIPDSVTTIAYGTFWGCTSLTSVKIPGSVITIGEYAFADCGSLKSAKFPDSVTTIGQSAFSNCTGLTSVEIPDSVTTIAGGTFIGCSSLKSVMIPNSVTTIGEYAFSDCDSLTSIEIPNSVTTIERCAFVYCDSLTSIEIPTSVTTIGEDAFGSNYDLKEIVFCGNAPSIESTIFGYVSATAYYPAGNTTWTSDVMKGFGGYITWVPYTLDENGDMITNAAAAVTTVAEIADIDVNGTPDEIPVMQNGLEISTPDFGDWDEPLNSNAVYDGEYSTVATDTYTLKTASFSGLVPGQQYVLLAMVSIDVEDPLAADNLLCIDQAAALEDGTLVFQYVQRTPTEISYVVACGASNKDLNDAEITFPEMIADGETLIANPTVVYDGKTLTEGQDYIIQGTVSITEPGIYTCYIRGIRNYSGLAECTYAVISPYKEVAYGFCGDNMTWTFYDNGRLTISGNGPMMEFDGYSAVPWNDRRSSITTVIIEDGVTTIGNFAFAECTNLREVKLGESVTTIGNGAFRECTSLNAVKIPDSVTTIGGYVFQDCTSLSKVTIGSSLTEISPGAFGYCSSLESVTIGESVTTIKSAAFQSCTSLKNIMLPNSVVDIGNSAFKSCTNLASVTIGEAVTIIGGSAFSGCKSLTNVEIPESVTSIGESAFAFCSNLTGIHVDESNPNYSCDDRGVLFDREKVELIQAPGAISGTYEIPDSVITINDSAFGNCGSLTSVKIPDSVTDIGNSAFQYCRSLTSVKIPNSMTTISDYAFYECDGLKSVEIPDSVTAIGNSAFRDCGSLINVEMPDGIITIDNLAFASCTKLINITIPNGVTAIGDYAFSYCTGLKAVEIPESVKVIGQSVFRKCYNLEMVTIPDSVTTIGDDTFYECFRLSSITIPASVTTIGESAFYDCTNLGRITFAGDAPVVSEGAFSGVTATAYYPVGNPTWISDKLKNYGGNITWVIDCPNHSYETAVTEPTCTEYGFTTYTCTKCGYSYIADETEPIGHIYESVSTGDGKLIHTCIVCGDSYTEVIPGALLYTVYEDYVEITGHMENPSELVIPTEIGGVPVKIIGDYAFANYVELINVTIPDTVTSIGDEVFANCSNLETIRFVGDAPEFGNSVFWGVDGSVYYPGDNSTWTSEMMENVDIMNVRWVAEGEVFGMEIVSIPECGFIGREPDMSGLCVELIYGNDIHRPVDITTLSISEIDTTTAGKKNVTVGYGVFSAEFTYGVHDREPGIVLDASIYPESKHNYQNGVYETQTLSWPGATSIVLKFSDETYVERNCDWIYVYDGNGKRIAFFTGSEASGVTVEVPGESVDIDLFSNWSGSAYGYSFDSITAMGAAIHTGTENTLTVEPTCTEPGRSEFVCEICDLEQHTVIPELGHNFEDGVCTRCGEVEPTEPEEDPITITSQPADYVGMVGDTATFTVAAEGEGLKYQWYCSTDGGANWGTTGVTGDTQSVVFLAYRNHQLYRCVITDAEGNTVTTDAAELKAKEVSLEITGQPENYVGAVGDEATFTLVASGNGLTYEWFVSSDGGATWAKSYMTGYMSDTQIAVLRPYRDGYKLYCKVSDVFGNTVNSDIVSMTVKSGAVKINSQPQSVENAAILQMYAFTVGAEGENLTYLWEVSTNGGATWEQSWSDGYNTDTLNIRMYQYRDGYQYRCVVTSGLKTVVVTEAATLKLQAPSVAIETSPVSAYALLYEEVTMQVTATGMDLTYQWYYSTDDGATWVENWMTGYNTDTLTFVAIPTRAALYMCKVTDGSGTSVWTEPAQMKILSEELKITSEPENFTGKVGDTASFTVVAEGEGVGYRWYLSSDGGVTWSECWFDGYNTNRLSFYINANRAANQYRCVITDVAGNTVTSSTVTVVAE